MRRTMKLLFFCFTPLYVTTNKRTTDGKIVNIGLRKQRMTHCLSKLASRQFPTVDYRTWAPIVHSSHRHSPNFQARSIMHKSRYKRGQSSGSSKQSGLPKRPPLTHFLCLPLVTEISKPQLEASLFQFQESLSTKFADGLPAVNDAPRKVGQAPRTLLIPPRAIRPVGTIHFTLGVMSLETGSRVQEAVEFLKGLDVKTMVEESVRKNGTLDYLLHVIQRSNLDSRPFEHVINLSTLYA